MAVTTDSVRTALIRVAGDWRRSPRAIVSHPAAGAIALAAAVARMFHIVWILRPPNVQLDFSSYYVWSSMMRDGLNPYRLPAYPYAMAQGVLTGTVLRANYPPSFILMMEPLTLLKPWAACWTWCILSVLLLAATLVVLMRKKGLPVSAALVIGALATIYRPVQIHFEFLQVQVLVMFLLVMMYRALEKGRDSAVGFWLAAAALIKVYPLFMLLYLGCLRRWRAMLFTVVWLLAGAAVTVAMVGSRAWSFFPAILPVMAPHPGWSLLPMVGISSTIVRIFDRLIPSPSLGLEWLRRTIEAGFVCAIFWMTIRETLNARGDRKREEYAFGLCVAAMVVLLPNAWPHYMVLFIVPIVQIAVAAFRGAAPRDAIVTMAAAYLIAEASYTSANLSLARGASSTALWLIEGMSVSSLLTFVAASMLAVHADRPARLGNNA